MEWNTITANRPITPYIREAGYDKRGPWYIPKRKLLDYLLVYVEEGECLFQVGDREYSFSKGEFCLVQPNEVVVLSGTTQTITPFVHLDLFYNPEREASFPTKPGQMDISGFSHLIQPRLNDIN